MDLIPCGHIELMNPYQKHELTKDNVTRLRKFRQSVSKRLNTKFYELPKDWIKNQDVLVWLFNDHAKNFDLWFYPELLDINKWMYHLCCIIDSDMFSYWWDADKIDYVKSSCNLAKYCGRNFTVWWDADKFSWKESGSSYLASGCGKFFDVWWDAEKFDYQYGAVQLAQYCKDNFDQWWDRSKIDDYTYKYTSRQLTSLSDKFDIWFEADLFMYDVMDNAHQLLERCSEHFDKFWNPDKFSKEWWFSYSAYMCKEYTSRFDIWFDKAKFNYHDNFDNTYRKSYGSSKWRDHPTGRHALMKYCSEHFMSWWDRQRIRPNAKNMELLEKYCVKWEDHWRKDFILFKLGEESEAKEEEDDW